jgi:hypothetical protein
VAILVVVLSEWLLMRLGGYSTVVAAAKLSLSFDINMYSASSTDVMTSFVRYRVKPN